MHIRPRPRWPALAAAVPVLLAAAIAAPAVAQDLEPPLSVSWVFSMAPDPQDTLAPVIAGDRVFITHGGVLRALDIRTGAEQWKYEVSEEAAVSTAPVLSGDLVIVGTDSGQVVALKAADGTKAWEKTYSGSICPTPMIMDDALIAAAGKNVYGLDARSGSARWVCAVASAVAAGPVTDGSMLYFLGQDGSVESVDPREGRFRWRANLPVPAHAFGPIAAEQRVIVAGGRNVVAVARSGSVAWTAEMPAGVGGAPTVVEDTLYVPCLDGRIYTLYARSGAPRREVQVSVAGAVTAPPLVTPDLVFAGTSTSLVYALDRKSGAVRWVYRCRAPEQGPGDPPWFGIYAPLVGAEGSLFCLTGTGDLYCLSPSAPDTVPPQFADLKPEPGDALPGGESVAVSFAVVDDGSGVDPASVSATVNGTAVTVEWDVASGVGKFVLSKPADGSHIIRVTASDYRGNSGSVAWSFVTDKAIKPAEEGQTTTRSTTTGIRRSTTTGIRGRTTR